MIRFRRVAPKPWHQAIRVALLDTLYVIGACVGVGVGLFVLGVVGGMVWVMVRWGFCSVACY